MINHGFKKSMKNLALFKVLGKVLGYVGPILADFCFFFPLFYVMFPFLHIFHAILRYTMLVLRYITFFYATLFSL